VLDGVCVVWAGLLEKPFEVVCRQPRLMLVIACGSRGGPHTGGACLTVIAIGCGPDPLKALLAPLFATINALLGAVGGDVGRRLALTAQGRLPTSLCRLKHDSLVAGGALGGDVVRFLECVPKEVTMSTLSWALRTALEQHTWATPVSLGLVVLTMPP
jgi:hypothetical protein